MKQPTLADLYFDDEFINTAGVVQGLMSGAKDGDQSYTFEKHNDGSDSVFYRTDSGLQYFLGVRNPEDIQLAAGPTDVVSDAGGAAFGIYPSMGKRTQKSDIGEKMITGAPDFAAGGVRGFTASSGGILGDMQKLGRFIGAIATDNEGGSIGDKLTRAGAAMEGKTFFPSTEDWNKEGYTIPGTSITIPPLPAAVPAGTSAFGMTPEERQKASEAGQFVGELTGDPFAAYKVGKLAVKGVSKLAETLAPKAAEMARQGVEKMVAPMQTYAVPPDTSAASKAMAPASDIGFYSAVEQAALNIKRNSGTGQAMLNDITKGENVKADEIKWLGLDDFLKGKKNVTKQEVQDYIAQNRVDVQEVQLGGGADVRAKADIDYAEGRLTRDQYNQILDSSGAPSKFGQYTLPGGENYREILLTMPEKQTPIVSPDTSKWTVITKQTSPSGARQVQVRDDQGNMVGQRFGFQGSDEDAIQDVLPGFLESRSKVKQNESNYRSSHWDQPNVLAHMRVNDRIDADGKKMLLIEEVQSDWHQAGREKGYGPKMEKTVEAYYETKSGQRIPIGFGKTKEEAEASIDVGWKNMVDIKYDTIERKIGEGVPDAPFKDTWYQLALKRAMKYAADNGYDRIGLTTGKRQIQRYPEAMRQVADEIVWDSYAGGNKALTVKKEGANIFGAEVDNNGIIVRSNVTEAIGKPLQDVIGKSMADKAISKPSGEIKSADFTVGGEGMKKYYDEIYPKFLDKYGKKWGAKVQEGNIPQPPKSASEVLEFTGGQKYANGQITWSELVELNPSLKREFTEPIRYIDITPEMRKSVGKGQPLFTAAPLTIPAASETIQDRERK
jgi:hypothetical protein